MMMIILNHPFKDLPRYKVRNIIVLHLYTTFFCVKHFISVPVLVCASRSKSRLDLFHEALRPQSSISEWSGMCPLLDE